MFEKVLIPTDLSEQSDAIIARAGRISTIREIVLLHIMDRRGIDNNKKNRDRVPDSAERTAQEKLKRQQALIRAPGIIVRTVIRENTAISIPEMIIQSAEIERPSLIIMGARKGLLSGSLLGSGGTTCAGVRARSNECPRRGQDTYPCHAIFRKRDLHSPPSRRTGR